MPHGIIALSPLSSNPTPVSHNPSLWTAVRQASPACPSDRRSENAGACVGAGASAANPSAARTTQGKLNCGAGCQPAADWQSASAHLRGSPAAFSIGAGHSASQLTVAEETGPRNAAARAGNRRRKPPSYSEFVRKNSLVTSFQFVPGSAASRSSAGRPPSAATAPASAGCRA